MISARPQRACRPGAVLRYNLRGERPSSPGEIAAVLLTRTLLPILSSIAVLAGGCGYPVYGDDDGADDDAGDDDAASADEDGDGYPADVDCDDTDAALNWDDADQDGWSTCEGDCDDFDASLTPTDADGDGFSSCDGDCDDGEPLTYPGAPEQCDGADNDCDGTVDEDTGIDADGDGYSPCEGDCHDGNNAVYPGAPQICDGQGDNDCDGSQDPNESDVDGDAYTPCGGDCNDHDAAVHPFAADVCDNHDDNDCDGAVDPLEADDDGDGLAECDDDCDDADAANFPGNAEACDGADNDCDGAPETDGDGVCGIWLLPSGATQWTARGWNEQGSPHAPSAAVEAAFSIEDLDRSWVVTHGTYHVLDWATMDWIASGSRDTLFPEVAGVAVLAASAIAAHWSGEPDEATVILNTADTAWRYRYDIGSGATALDSADSYGPGWGPPSGPDPADLTSCWLDLYNADGHAAGSPLSICGIGETSVGPYYAMFTGAGTVHLYEAGWCFEFYDSQPTSSWSVFNYAGAPAASVVEAATAGDSSLLLFGPMP